MSQIIPSMPVIVRVKTIQKVKLPLQLENEFPIREWSVQLYLVNMQTKELVSDRIIKSCKYVLHPSFENNIIKIKNTNVNNNNNNNDDDEDEDNNKEKSACTSNSSSGDHLHFLLKNTGWGEFEIKISCQLMFSMGKFLINHYLNFDAQEYDTDYEINVPLNNPRLNKLMPDLLKSQLTPIPRTTVKGNNLAWIDKIRFLDEDIVTEVVQMIINHPVVRKEIKNYPLDKQDFKILSSALPDELLDAITVTLKPYFDDL